MQQFLDYIAVVLFVVVYFVTRDIFLATGVLMAGVTLQVAAYLVLKKPIGNELKFTFWASMLLGGMTLLLRDETFIQWKPTIVSWLMGASLIGAHLIARVFLIQRILGQALKLPDQAWLHLTYGWGTGFFLAGAINLWVADTFSMDAWVTFKFIGLMGINLLYLACTFAYLYVKGWLSDDNFIEPDNQPDPSNPPSNSSGTEGKGPL